jgi:dTDP-glucose 4,6-dehydratase
MTSFSPRRVLVTGGCGFLGSNFVRFFLDRQPRAEVVNVDALTYAGNPENLADLDVEPRYRFVRGDVRDGSLLTTLLGECDAVAHFAAESHVDRSIDDSAPFVETNVVGTQVLLDAARRAWSARGDGRPPFRGRFLHVSTDEVFGALPLDSREQTFSEDSPYAPNSPYAASKAASDMLVRACHHTFGLDVVITHASNCFGPYQFPEKIIPRFVTNLLEGRDVPLYGDGRHVRDWLHAVDHAEAVLAVLERGGTGERYCIGAHNQHSNLELTHTILELMGLDAERIRTVPDRSGHDPRYAVDARKIRRELGWEPSRSQWPEALGETIAWYANHRGWWSRILARSHREGSAPGDAE